MRTLEVNADTKELDNVNAFVAEQLEDCPMKLMMQIELVVEEVFVNIASYAYCDGEGKAWVSCGTDGDTLTMIFEDKGIPFDPLKKEDPDVTASAEDRQIGGLGIFLTKKLMDEVKYDRIDDKNRLTLVKKYK